MVFYDNRFYAWRKRGDRALILGLVRRDRRASLPGGQVCRLRDHRSLARSGETPLPFPYPSRLLKVQLLSCRMSKGTPFGVPLVRLTGVEPARSPTRSLVLRVCQFRHNRILPLFVRSFVIILHFGAIVKHIMVKISKNLNDGPLFYNYYIRRRRKASGIRVSNGSMIVLAV